jgi:hypothetical protein
MIGNQRGKTIQTFPAILNHFQAFAVIRNHSEPFAGILIHPQSFATILSDIVSTHNMNLFLQFTLFNETELYV